MGTPGVISTQRNGSTVALEQVIPEPRGRWMAVPRQVNSLWDERDREFIISAGVHTAVMIGFMVMGSFGMVFALEGMGGGSEFNRMGIATGVVPPIVIGLTSLIRGAIDCVNSP